MRDKFGATPLLYKYGLQIIPYEGSATMMKNGDYYTHYHDHDMTINSIRRHSHKEKL